MAEVGIEFTTEEILVLTELTGLQPPSGLGIDSFDDMPDAYRDYARESANRTLGARGVVDKDGRVNDAVVTVLELAAAPPLLAISSVERDGVVETAFHTVSPDLGLTHSCPATSVHRFTPFPPRELMVRLLRHADIRPSKASPVEPFTVGLDEMQAAAELVETGDHDAGARLLEDAGVPESCADAFCSAMVEKAGSATITILHRPEEEVVEGGSLTWLDTGFSGLWVTESILDDDGAPTSSVEVTPRSGESVASDLLSYLPEAFAAGSGDAPQDS